MQITGLDSPLGWFGLALFFTMFGGFIALGVGIVLGWLRPSATSDALMGWGATLGCVSFLLAALAAPFLASVDRATKVNAIFTLFCVVVWFVLPKLIRKWRSRRDPGQDRVGSNAAGQSTLKIVLYAGAAFACMALAGWIIAWFFS